MHNAGGVSAIINELLKKPGAFNGDCLTVSGKTLRENVEGCEILNKDVIHPFDNPHMSEAVLPYCSATWLLTARSLKSVRLTNPLAATTSVLRSALIRKKMHSPVSQGQSKRRTRCRNPLRRTEGRTGHAGNARSDFANRRYGSRRQSRFNHGRPFLGRFARHSIGQFRRKRLKAVRSRSSKTATLSISIENRKIELQISDEEWTPQSQLERVRTEGQNRLSRPLFKLVTNASQAE